jgi:hypothetical protein
MQKEGVMGTPTILVPYNFTAIDKKAIEFTAKTFSPRKESRITLFHIYIPLPQIETAYSTVMARLSSSMHYLSGDLKDKEAALRNTREMILGKGFGEHQVDYIFRPRSKPVAEEIIETAAGRYDVIVLSYRSYRITRAFVQSIHNKVIAALRDITVCIVT